MPSRDPKTGKELSGKQKRDRKEAKENAEADASSPTKPDTGEWAKEFETCGQPNLDDPGTDLDYTRRLQLVCLKQMATTPFPTPAQRECWKRIREMSAAVGLTSNKAQLEAKVRKLETLLKERQHKSGAVDERPAKSIKRPSTARGAKPPGPRPIPPDADPGPESPPKE